MFVLQTGKVSLAMQRNLLQHIWPLVLCLEQLEKEQNSTHSTKKANLNRTLFDSIFRSFIFACPHNIWYWHAATSQLWKGQMSLLYNLLSGPECSRWTEDFDETLGPVNGRQHKAKWNMLALSVHMHCEGCSLCTFLFTVPTI